MQEYIRDLVWQCSRGMPHRWKELWMGWRYSEVVEYAQVLSEKREKENDELERLDIKSSEQLTALFLARILARL